MANTLEGTFTYAGKVYTVQATEGEEFPDEAVGYTLYYEGYKILEMDPIDPDEFLFAAYEVGGAFPITDHYDTPTEAALVALRHTHEGR